MKAELVDGWKVVLTAETVEEGFILGGLQFGCSHKISSDSDKNDSITIAIDESHMVITPTEPDDPEAGEAT
jgi:hypothetical protein